MIELKTVRDEETTKIVELVAFIKAGASVTPTFTKVVATTTFKKGFDLMWMATLKHHTLRR